MGVQKYVRILWILAPSLLVSSLIHSLVGASAEIHYGPVYDSGIELALFLLTFLLLVSAKRTNPFSPTFSIGWAGITAFFAVTAVLLLSVFGKQDTVWNVVRVCCSTSAFICSFFVFLPASSWKVIITTRKESCFAIGGLLGFFLAMDLGLGRFLWMQSGLSKLTATLVTFFLRPFGTEATLTTGVSGELLINTPSYTNLVAYQCAGFEGVYLFLATAVAIFVLDNERFEMKRWFPFVAVGTLAMLILNVARIALIAAVAELAFQGSPTELSKATSGMFHSGIGTLLYAVGIPLMLSFFYGNHLLPSVQTFGKSAVLTLVFLFVTLAPQTASGACLPNPCCGGSGSLDTVAMTCWVDCCGCTPCNASPELPKGWAGRISVLFLAIGTYRCRRKHLSDHCARSQEKSVRTSSATV